MTRLAIPLIIDTDIGDDIDDALALALALRSPEVELLGVTTVFQRAELRARLAQLLLAAYGRAEVPVHAGVDRPLLGEHRPDWSPNQADVLEGAPETAPPPGQAVDFLIRQGMSRDGLVLLPIGAMTNIALALALEPRLADRVRVVAMAGAWDRSGAEWNVQCDPEAVAAVLASGVRIDFVGLDVTTRVVLPASDLAALTAAPGKAEAMLTRFLRAWQRGWGRPDDFCPVLHDPLALAALLRPELVRFRAAAVAVELGSALLRGQTVARGGQAAANARIAVDVDREGFLALLGGRVCGRS